MKIGWETLLKKNCHFLDILNDEVGPNGVSVNPDKIFNEEAEWNYGIT
jgi:hypothetical protein